MAFSRWRLVANSLSVVRALKTFRKLVRGRRQYKYGPVTCLKKGVSLRVNKPMGLLNFRNEDTNIEEAKTNSKINLFHQNVRSIRNKLPQLELLVNQLNIDCLCLTETWLEEDEVTFYSPSQSLILASHFTRNQLSHGGVAVYLRSDMDFKIQSLVVGTVFLYWLNNVDQSHKSLQYWISTNKLIYVTGLFQSFLKNIEIYLQSSVVFVMFHICTSALLIYAALKFNVPLMWPYLFVEFFRLAILFFIHVTAMLITKENVLDLGVLITLSLSGGFLLLGLFYCWFCVISLCQCIQELNETPPASANQVSDMNFLPVDFKHLTKVAQSFHRLQAVPNLGYRDYQYNNLTKPTY